MFQTVTLCPRLVFVSIFTLYLVIMIVSPPLPLEESKLNYGICREFVCYLTPPGKMMQRHFCHCFSSKWKVVGDINYIVESAFLGERKQLDGERMSLKLSGVTIAQ